MKSQSGGLREGLLSRRRKPAVATATGGLRRGILAAGTNRNIARLILDDASAVSPQRLSGSSTDPNRSARIALIKYADGERSYILAPNGLRVGSTVAAGDDVAPDLGNALPLRAIPLGTNIHNIELSPGRGGQVARSAGQQATLTNIEGGYALVKMPSGEIRRIHENCFATIGQVGNVDHMNVSSGKAGRTRWRGRRPHVRGMVMNPIDHPMGGGQGKSKGGGGRHHPVSPWGQLAKGFKTRSKHKPSDRFILERRRPKKKT